MTTIRPVTRADAAWALDVQSRHYAVVEGFDRSFEDDLARALDTLFGQGVTGWIAMQDCARIGSIFTPVVAASQRRLQLFFVTAAARQQGAGQALLTHALSQASRDGARTVAVATFAEHAAACRLYQRNGFACVSREPVRRYGRDLTETHWEKRLAPG